MPKIKQLTFTRLGLQTEIAKLHDGWHQVESRYGSGEIVWRNAKDFCEFDEICSPDWTQSFPSAVQLFFELPIPRSLTEDGGVQVSWQNRKHGLCISRHLDRSIAICLAWYRWKTGICAEVSDEGTQ